MNKNFKVKDFIFCEFELQQVVRMEDNKGDKYLMQDEVFSEVAIRRADALIKLLIPPPPKSK